jgi:hypothetical protein
VRLKARGQHPSGNPTIRMPKPSRRMAATHLLPGASPGRISNLNAS